MHHRVSVLLQDIANQRASSVLLCGLAEFLILRGNTKGHLLHEGNQREKYPQVEVQPGSGRKCGRWNQRHFRVDPFDIRHPLLCRFDFPLLLHLE